ncbi:DUF4012 domain-containing protein [Candidatus Uhrbacteria bacterium]|nr:DUF4012 domain-containing protein [Candidatus Uhrbacteria bacterium]
MSHLPNFLEYQSGPRPRRFLRWWLWLMFLFVAGLLFVGILIGSRLGAGRTALLEGKAFIRQAEEKAKQSDFAAVGLALRDALDSLGKADRRFAQADWMSSLPWIGKQVKATRELIAASEQALTAALEINSVAIELNNVMAEFQRTRGTIEQSISPGLSFASLLPEEKRTLLARLVASIPKFEFALDRIRAARRSLANIPQNGLLSVLDDALAPLRRELPRIQTDLEGAIPLLKLFTTVAGYPEVHRSLVLFLNNAELRPGGGFIGAVGSLRVVSGEIINFETRDSYDFVAPAPEPPPAPLRRYLGLEQWFLRDANWFPDFRLSSETALDFYSSQEVPTPRGGPDIDSVIGFTPVFASDILRITGPITIDGQTFTAENLFDTLEYQVERGFTERGVPYAQRKEILARLVKAAIERLMSLPASRAEEVIAAALQGFREKQLMIFAVDPELQALIERQDWGGRLQVPSASDFVMVVDANLGSLKSDPAVKRVIHYQIKPDNDRYRAQVSVTYRHEGTFDWKTTRYRTYTRVYTPRASEFLTASGLLRDDRLKNPRQEPGQIEVGEEKFADDQSRPATVFGGFLSVEPGEERTLVVEYFLPDAVVREQGCYELVVPKQLGAFGYELTLDLDFGKTIVSSRPTEASENRFDRRYTVTTDLGENREFEICF